MKILKYLFGGIISVCLSTADAAAKLDMTDECGVMFIRCL